MTSRLRIVIADDERPARAFELNAVDYLRKPVDRRRLREMLTRAHERLERDSHASSASASSPSERVPASTGSAWRAIHRPIPAIR
jgi:two-component SAPR family response regulator